MLKRTRKSSATVSLVLIGTAVASLSGCGKQEMRRDVYASKEACLADWGQTPQDCEPAYDQPGSRGANTHYYGRSYPFTGGASNAGRSSKAVGSSSTTSRGGFGSSGRASAS